MFSDYLISVSGQDLSFHLLRIEGIKDGLLSGQFPVRIHPTHLDGYGYPTGVFYPDLFLYIPAILRLIGFSVMNSYKVLLLIGNFATAFITYVCVRRVTGQKDLAVLGSALYTLSLYRLVNLYYRSALGESIAMTFVPLIILAIYLLLYEDSDEKKHLRDGMFVLILGCTGILQSHILTCEMLGIFTGLIMVISFVRIWRQKRWLYILSGGIITVGLNAGFLLPFIQYMRLDVTVKHWEIRDIMVHALNPVQIFFPFARAQGLTEGLPNGMAAEMPLGIGFAIAIAIILMLIYAKQWFEQEKAHKCRFGSICLFTGILALWMTTYCFPWPIADRIGGIFAKVMNMVQFPWRYLGVATILLTFAVVICINAVKKSEERVGIIFTLLLVSFFTCCMFSQKLYENDAMSRVYDTEGIQNLHFESPDYLLNQTDLSVVSEQSFSIYSNDGVLSYTKDGTNVQMYVKNEKETAQTYLLPIFYYPCYEAVDTETHNRIETLDGMNHQLALLVPEFYEGEITIGVNEPWLWRAAEALSLIVAVALMVLYFVTNRKLIKK